MLNLIASNKKAYYNYNIIEKYEAGIVLKGFEVKSVKDGKISIQEGWADIENGELFLYDVNITRYLYDNNQNYPENRKKKLLLKKKEILKLSDKIKQKGLTLIPLKIYIKKSLIKMEIGLGKGKKLFDKRQSKKEKDIKIKIQKTLKNY